MGNEEKNTAILVFGFLMEHNWPRLIKECEHNFLF